MSNTLPERMQASRLWSCDDAMALEFSTEAGAWAYSACRQFERVGDDAGEYEFAWWLTAIESHAPMLFARLRAKIWDALAQAREQIQFVGEPTAITCTAQLLHHGGKRWWTQATSKNPQWIYWMQSTPQMFSGGGVETLDGQIIQPRNNRLLLVSSQHRFQPVDCWSAHPLHGSWCLTGTIT